MQPTGNAAPDGQDAAASEASVQRLARLLSSLREVKNVWRDLTRVAFPGGVSGLGVLNLVHREGASRVSDLAACAHVGVSTMSRQVADLAAGGLLEREIAADDARSHVVRLTAAGAAELERARGQVLQRLAPALDSWTDDELAGLERQLTRLAHDLTAVTRRADERTA